MPTSRPETAWSETSRGGLLEELVAELFDGDERLAEHGQLFTEPPDMDVHCSRASSVFVAPYVGEKDVARQHPASMGEQIFEQEEFLGRQEHSVAAREDRVALAVNDDGSIRRGFRRRRIALCPAQQRSYARHQFARAEWLRDVVVCA